MAYHRDCITFNRLDRVNGMRLYTQILYSYLSGLAPVGKTIEVPREQIRQDCGFGHIRSYYHFLNDLIARGLVRRVACGSRQSCGVLVVVRHYEDWRREA